MVCTPKTCKGVFHTIIPSEDQGNQRRAQGPPPLNQSDVLKGSSGCKQIFSSGDHQGTAHRNLYSPNRAATQVSMKYRVKRNQCQDHILKPNQHSRSGQKMNRVKRNPTSTGRIGSLQQLAENAWLVWGVLEVPSGLAGSVYT